MNIAYFAPGTFHDAKWINHFAEFNKVYLFCPKNISDEFKDNFSKKVQVISILEPISIFNPYKRNKCIKLIDNFIYKYKVDICHVLYSIPYCLYVRKLAIPHIITCRGSDIFVDIPSIKKNSFNPINKIRREILLYWILSSFKKAAFITGTSLKLTNSIAKLTEHKSIKLIRTGVNFRNIKAQYSNNTDANSINILSPRSTLKGFNIDVILKSFHELTLEKKEDIKLHIIDGFKSNTSKYLRNYVKENNLEHKVFFYPFLKQKKLIELYSKVDIVVMIPDSDGTPNSGIESLFLKKILILGNNEYDQDIFNKDTCWTIKENTAPFLSHKINEILKTEHNKKLENASKIAFEKANFHLEIEKVFELYKRTLNIQDS